MAILGGASTIRSTGIAQSRAASNRASRARPKPKPRPRRSYSGGGGRSYTPRYSAPRRSSTRSGGSAHVSRAPANRPAKPILPIPSADAIAELFSQIAGYKRQYNQLGVNAKAQRRELGAARGLFLKQLLDAFERNRTSALEDFASRGLADSGIANEALARLQNEYGSQRSEYETNYTNQISGIMRQLQGRKADVLAQRAAAERRYNSLRAQRAAALRAAGYGG